MPLSPESQGFMHWPQSKVRHTPFCGTMEQLSVPVPDLAIRYHGQDGSFIGAPGLAKGSRPGVQAKARDKEVPRYGLIDSQQLHTSVATCHRETLMY